MKKILVGIIVIGMFATTSVFAACYAADMTSNSQTVTLKNSIVTVPAGVSFGGVFLAPISSSYAYTGQEINLALSRDFYYNSKLVAPAGSSVTGTVIEVERAKHGSMNGKLTLRFTHIITPSGVDIPISAVVKGDDGSGTLYGGSKWEVLSGGNGYIDSEEGVIAQNINPSFYAAKENGVMQSLGTGGGLVKSIWDKGSDVEIAVNSPIDLVLIQPITTNPSIYEN